MLSLLRSYAANRHLIRDFVLRDLKARYVGSSMGFFWSVVFPIINLVVFMFVFRIVLKARWGDQQGALEVALVMLAGIVVWAAFAETVSRATNCLVENANLIQKVVFPSEVLPVFLTISSLINMCIGMPVVLLSVLWFGFVSPPDAQLALVNGRDAVIETHDPGDPVEVEVSLERSFRRPVTLPVAFGGTAEPGVDYLGAVDEVTLPAGANRLFLRVVPLRDAETEGDETVVVSLPGGGDVGVGEVGEVSVRIVDGQPLGDGENRATVEDAAVRHPARVAGHHPLDLGVSLVALPLLLALQAVFTVGLGYFLSTLNIFLRDTYHLIGVGITVWMFGTPIFYPDFMVVEAGYGWLLQVNPMHWLIEGYRQVLLYAQWPDPWLTMRFLAVSVLLLWVGSRFFQGQKKRFPDLL